MIQKRIICIILFLCSTMLAMVSFFKLEHENNSMVRDSTTDFPTFNSSDVRKVRVFWGKQETTLVFQDDYWTVKEKDYALAATSKVVDLLESLGKISPLKEIECDDLSLKELNLLDHANEANQGEGIHLDILGENDILLFRMTLGLGHLKLSQEQIGNYAIKGYDGRYVKVAMQDGKNRVFLISQVFESCSPQPAKWLEQLYLPHAESPLHIRFMKKNNGELSFSTMWMVTASNQGYHLVLPVNQTFSIQDLSRKISLLATPFSSDIAKISADALTFNHSFLITMTDGFSYKIDFAEKDEQLFAKMSVSLSEEQLKPTNEETKEQFEKRKKYMHARFQYETRTCSEHVFIIRNDLLQQLSKPPIENKKSSDISPLIQQVN